MKYKTKKKGNYIINLLEDFYGVDRDLFNKVDERYTLPFSLQYGDLVIVFSSNKLCSGSDDKISIYNEKTQKSLYEFNNIRSKEFYARILNTSLFQSILKEDYEKAFTQIFQFLGCDGDIFNSIFNLPNNIKESFISSGELTIFPSEGIITKRFKSVIGRGCELFLGVNNLYIGLSGEGLGEKYTNVDYDLFDLKIPEEKKSLILKINNLFKR